MSRANTEQLYIKDNQLHISNTSNTKDRKDVWIWNKSTNRTDFDLKYSKKSDEKKLDYRSKKFKTKKEAILET